MGATGLIFLRREHAAKHWLNTQRCEKAWRHRTRVHLFRLITTSDGETVVGVNGHIVEYVVLFLPVQVIRRRHRKLRHTGKALRGRNMPDPHQAIGIFKFKWPQQYGIYDAEYGGVDANARGQRDYRDRGKTWALQQLA